MVGGVIDMTGVGRMRGGIGRIETRQQIIKEGEAVHNNSLPHHLRHQAASQHLIIVDHLTLQDHQAEF